MYWLCSLVLKVAQWTKDHLGRILLQQSSVQYRWWAAFGNILVQVLSRINKQMLIGPEYKVCYSCLDLCVVFVFFFYVNKHFSPFDDNCIILFSLRSKIYSCTTQIIIMLFKKIGNIMTTNYYYEYESHVIYH